MSSRNEPEIEKKLRYDERQTRLSLELQENAEQVSRAVNSFIDAKLSSLELLQQHPELRDNVRSILYKKANGTFLWVALVIQELGKEDVEKCDVPMIVQELPQDLNGLYNRMLRNIERRKRHAESCRRILATVTLAYRPLHLAELGGLSGLQETDAKSLDYIRSMVAKCGSFLTIQTDQVYLIHQSAADYLLSQQASALLFPDSVAAAHYNILTRSLRLMCDALHRDMYGLGAPGFLIKEVQKPDLDVLVTVRYSCVYWVDHIYDMISDKYMKLDELLQDGGIVCNFLETKFLYWLEALSLLRAVPEGVIAIRKLKGIVVSILRPT